MDNSVHSVGDGTVVSFGEPIPGLTGITEYVLVQLADNGSLYSLRAVDDPSLRLLLTPTWAGAPADYSVELDDELCAELDMSAAGQAAVFLVVTPGESLADSSVNLLAPVIVNTDNARAAQVVLTNTGYPIKSPIGG